jgi:hypothetical protein
MRQLDRKNRSFYRELTDEERKKFSNYLMIRWASCVEGSREMQEFYLISTNERLNKHFFNISAAKHKKLQWLLATTVSPGLGTQRHNWIAPKKKDATLSGKRKQLAEIYPHLKDDEINVLAAITSQKEINEYLKKFGEGS